MHFMKLHLAGFKTFVEATDFVIEPGLTGIVGPNGCGKSNLVEAMRWVMGESSSKSMRASGMDDVIFSGGGSRPSRNIAEVGLILDNKDRSAPSGFNDSDVLEVFRRIEREKGSAYRINGREVRAKDVQLLFADAASGSRSPAMVKQGQIGEMIAAKPQARRRILEDAAGVAGLYSRRYEAEAKLKGAEENLARLEDILRQIDSQAEALKRQARQAIRYRGLAAEIRRNEALLALIQHSEACRQLAEAERQFSGDRAEVEVLTKAQAEAARLEGIAAFALPPLREQEAELAAEVQKLSLAKESLKADERRAKSRLAELERVIAQMQADSERETVLVADAESVLRKLKDEQETLSEAERSTLGFEAKARRRLVGVEASLAISEKAFVEVQEQRSNIEARRASLTSALAEEARGLARFTTESSKIAQELTILRQTCGSGEDRAVLHANLDIASAAVAAAEQQAQVAETRHAEAREAEARLRQPLAEAQRKAQKLETEVLTLTKLLSGATEDLWPAIIDEIKVEKGFEGALGAALGEDLEASAVVSAPAHWAKIESLECFALPEGVVPLSSKVKAPPALQRRLDQIGLVARSEGARLRLALRPGQRLVSQEGDLWRWDGFTQAAEAPTPAARRLVEKNRLGDLSLAAETARAEAELLQHKAEAAQAEVKTAALADGEARQLIRTALREQETMRTTLAAAERAEAQAATRLAALGEAEARLANQILEAQEKQSRAEAALAGLAEPGELTERLEAARNRVAQDRTAMGQAKGDLQSHLREVQARALRLKAIDEELRSWDARNLAANRQIDELKTRLQAAKAEHQRLIDTPDAFFLKERALAADLEAKEANWVAASTARAKAEAELVVADAHAREALASLSAVRESKARSEAWVEAAQQKCAEVTHKIATELECEIADLAQLAEIPIDTPLPSASEVEKKLEGLKQDRQRLGAVNLRADTELEEALGSQTNLTRERADLTEAIARLRQAISNLNREGRERLLAAFHSVNAHFKDLFTTLFQGGSAELQLVESEDPLEAGLEILAMPPGKRPQVMTLLSGGEQALTALSLIFAIFLTNPAPICVLDEVDAPLDDANVERFCDLLDHMAAKTQTRFITITHNPITMARMNRLFGVTMAERGVSQLVSVDLDEAERFLDVG